MRNCATKSTMLQKILTPICFIAIWGFVHLNRNDECLTGKQFDPIKRKKLSSYFKVINGVSVSRCQLNCWYYGKCKSINYNDLTNECQLSADNRESSVTEIVPDWTYFEVNQFGIYQGQYCLKHKPCPETSYCLSTCQPPWYQCKCKNKQYNVSTCGFCVNDGKCTTLCDGSYKCLCFGKECISKSPIGSTALHFITASKKHELFPVDLKDATKTISVCTWFNSDLEEASHLVSLFLQIQGGLCNAFLIRIGNAGNIKLSSLFGYFKAEYYIERSKWYHLCLTVNSDRNVKFFINGVEVSSHPINTSATFHPNSVVVGQDLDSVNGVCTVSDASQTWRGYISQVNIWNMELSSDDVGVVYDGNYPEGDIVSWTRLLQVNEYPGLIEKKRISTVD